MNDVFVPTGLSVSLICDVEREGGGDVGAEKRHSPTSGVVNRGRLTMAIEREGWELGAAWLYNAEDSGAS